MYMALATGQGHPLSGGLLEETMPPDSFIGHIGGDDFVVILQTHDTDAVCKALIRRFDEGIPAFIRKGTGQGIHPYKEPKRRGRAVSTDDDFGSRRQQQKPHIVTVNELNGICGKDQAAVQNDLEKLPYYWRSIAAPHSSRLQ
jgi:GGDEF domain-containing protein